MKAEDIPNILLIADMIDSLFARGQKMVAGMKAAAAEERDLTDNELLGFKAEADEEDAKLRDAIEARRQREVLGETGPSDKLTGDQGGDIRP